MSNPGRTQPESTLSNRPTAAAARAVLSLRVNSIRGEHDGFEEYNESEEAQNFEAMQRRICKCHI